jgi:hypothetical protein
MRWAFVIVCATCTLSAQVSVRSGKQIRVPAPDATSVISLDLNIAQASLENGIVTITGVDPGDTLLVAVTDGGLRQIPVHVLPGPPQYPPGFVAPLDSNNEASSYEFRFSSDRQQIENI